MNSGPLSPDKSGGVTLLELLIVVVIAALLLATAVPPLGQLVHKSEADGTIHILVQAWQQARSQALTRSTRIKICGSDNGTTCQKEWQQQLVLFVDENNNDHPDSNEVVQVYEVRAVQGMVQTRIGLGKNYAYIEPTGKAPLTGSFLYCHRHDSGLERKISWNLAGRLYMTGSHTHHTGSSSVHCAE